MSEQTVFEKMGVRYEERDGILYPILGACDGTTITGLGKYGRAWITWLFDLDRMLHRKYLLEGTLVEKALEFQEYASELEDEIVSGLGDSSEERIDFLMSVAIERQKWEVAQEIIIRDGCDAIIKNKMLREGRTKKMTRRRLRIMRELRIDGTLILAVDHGYGNIKTANTVFSNGFVARDTEPVMSTDYLYYEGKYYVLDQGHKNYTKDKVADDDFYILTVAAIAKELYLRNIRSERLHLAVGVPLKWMDSQKESFQAYLLQNPEIRFVYKGKRFEVEIAGCSVMPQCYAAVAEKLSEFKGLNMVVDIGNGTMNAMFLQDGRAVENKMWTELYGVRQCALKIHQAMLDRFQEDIPDSVINTFLMNHSADIDPEYEHLMEIVAKRYVEELEAKILDFGYNEKTMKMYVLGGGAKLLEHFSYFDKNRITFDFDIHANAKGYEYFCYVALRRKKNHPAG